MNRRIKKSTWNGWHKPPPESPIDEFRKLIGKYEVICRKETDDNKFFAEIRHYKHEGRYSFYFCDISNIENVRNFFSETISGAKARGNLYLLNLGFYVKNILS
jgi:hypothetical protein